MISEAKDRVDIFTFSRDDKWVVFSRVKPGERQIWLASLEKEAAPIQLTKAWDASERQGVGADSTCFFFHAPDGADTDEPECKEKK